MLNDVTIQKVVTLT